MGQQLSLILLIKYLYCDLNNQDTFSHIGDWLKEVDKQTQLEDVIKIVIGNKSDMKTEREVTPEDIKVY